MKWVNEKPHALDLFCGAGGATRGLQRAGFYVTGIDVKPQPRYCGDAFRQGDALTFPLEGYALIWASPPCQAFTSLKNMHNARKDHPNLIPQMRERLLGCNTPWVMENVEGAPLGETGNLILLCGTMFGLKTADGAGELRRHRLFETSFSIPLWPKCAHGQLTIGVHGGHGRDRRRSCTLVSKGGGYNANKGRPSFPITAQKEAMGIDWMDSYTLSQAIPPAYSEFIGKQALKRIAQCFKPDLRGECVA